MMMIIDPFFFAEEGHIDYFRLEVHYNMAIPGFFFLFSFSLSFPSSLSSSSNPSKIIPFSNNIISKSSISLNKSLSLSLLSLFSLSLSFSPPSLSLSLSLSLYIGGPPTDNSGFEIRVGEPREIEAGLMYFGWDISPTAFILPPGFYYLFIYYYYYYLFVWIDVFWVGYFSYSFYSSTRFLLLFLFIIIIIIVLIIIIVVVVLIIIYLSGLLYFGWDNVFLSDLHLNNHLYIYIYYQKERKKSQKRPTLLLMF